MRSSKTLIGISTATLLRIHEVLPYLILIVQNTLNEKPTGPVKKMTNPKVVKRHGFIVMSLFQRESNELLLRTTGITGLITGIQAGTTDGFTSYASDEN